MDRMEWAADLDGLAAALLDDGSVPLPSNVSCAISLNGADLIQQYPESLLAIARKRCLQLLYGVITPCKYRDIGMGAGLEMHKYAYI